MYIHMYTASRSSWRSFELLENRPVGGHSTGQDGEVGIWVHQRSKLVPSNAASRASSLSLDPYFGIRLPDVHIPQFLGYKVGYIYFTAYVPSH
jgi:hypothetical protein